MKPTRRIQRTAALGVAAGLAVWGLTMTPHGVAAGTIGQPSGNCSDGGGGEFKEVPILPGQVGGPITLALEIGTGNGTGNLSSLENLHVGLCYSDTAPGTPSNLAGGDISLWGPALGNGSTNPIFYGACQNDFSPAPVVLPQCVASVAATVTPTLGVCGLTCGATVTAVIPFSFCAGAAVGVHAVGSDCTSPTLAQTVTLGATGLILQSVTIGAGPNGTIGISSATTTLYVDGVAVPLAAGGGVVPGTIGAGTANTGPACLGPVGCPAPWVNVADGPLAWFVIPGVGTFPVNAPAGNKCFSLFTACPPPPYSLP